MNQVRQSDASPKELKRRLRIHAGDHENGKPDKNCQACQTLLKAINKK